MVSSFTNTNSFICMQLNGSKYYYVIAIIHFLHTVEWFQVLLFNTNNYFPYSSFIFTVK